MMQQIELMVLARVLKRMVREERGDLQQALPVLGYIVGSLILVFAILATLKLTMPGVVNTVINYITSQL